MAYDPNDPNDKRIVQELIDSALAEQQEQHEAEVAGLKKKRDDLLKQVRNLRAGNDTGGDDNGAEIDRLEGELRETKSKLTTTERELKKVTTERDTLKTSLDTETTWGRNQLIDRELTEALNGANVAPQYLKAAKALLREQVKVDGEGSDRKAVGIDGKPLGEFVKAWSQGDEGKHYVAAPNNGGGGGGGNSGTPPSGTTKKLADMTQSERVEMARKDPEGFRKLREEAGQVVN